MIRILFVPVSGYILPDEFDRILKSKGERTFKILKGHQWSHSTYRRTFIQFNGNEATVSGDQEDMFVGSLVGWIIRNASHVVRTFIVQIG